MYPGLMDNTTYHANSLATIARLTTIAHLASITLSPAFANHYHSPLTLKVPLHLISSLLLIVARCVCFASLTVSHPLQITLHLIYHFKRHLSCTLDGCMPLRGSKERQWIW